MRSRLAQAYAKSTRHGASRLQSAAQEVRACLQLFGVLPEDEAAQDISSRLREAISEVLVILKKRARLGDEGDDDEGAGHLGEPPSAGEQPASAVEPVFERHGIARTTAEEFMLAITLEAEDDCSRVAERTEAVDVEADARALRCRIDGAGQLLNDEADPATERRAPSSLLRGSGAEDYSLRTEATSLEGYPSPTAAAMSGGDGSLADALAAQRAAHIDAFFDSESDSLEAAAARSRRMKGLESKDTEEVVEVALDAVAELAGLEAAIAEAEEQLARISVQAMEREREADVANRAYHRVQGFSRIAARKTTQMTDLTRGNYSLLRDMSRRREELGAHLSEQLLRPYGTSLPNATESLRGRVARETDEMATVPLSELTVAASAAGDADGPALSSQIAAALHRAGAEVAPHCSVDGFLTHVDELISAGEDDRLAATLGARAAASALPPPDLDEHSVEQLTTRCRELTKLSTQAWIERLDDASEAAESRLSTIAGDLERARAQKLHPPAQDVVDWETAEGRPFSAWRADWREAAHELASLEEERKRNEAAAGIAP